MLIQHIRHATLRITIDDITFVVDPMLSDAQAMPPIDNSGDDRRNPLVSLPMPTEHVLQGATAILVTHTHRDHWDAKANELIDHHVRIICQPEDAQKFHDWHYEDVRAIHSAAVFGLVAIYRTNGQHGTGEIGRQMAPVSGYMLRSRAGESVYIAGDTVWCTPVQDAISRYRPQVIVVNAGAAQFIEGDPITMTAEDVIRVSRFAPQAKIVAVHMDSINHCRLRRVDLRKALAAAGIGEQVIVPADGEVLRF